jgi:ABC-2 type transport system permease protein
VVDGGWPWGQWAVLVAWGVVAGALARRFFRWSD